MKYAGMVGLPGKKKGVCGTWAKIRSDELNQTDKQNFGLWWRNPKFPKKKETFKKNPKRLNIKKGGKIWAEPKT